MRLRLEVGVVGGVACWGHQRHGRVAGVKVQVVVMGVTGGRGLLV